MIYASQQKNTSMLAKKHPFTCCLAASKAPKCSNFSVINTRENQWTYSTPKGIHFSTQNNFISLGSFGKVTTPVETIIPCLESTQRCISCFILVQQFTMKIANKSPVQTFSTKSSSEEVKISKNLPHFRNFKK